MEMRSNEQMQRPCWYRQCWRQVAKDRRRNRKLDHFVHWLMKPQRLSPSIEQQLKAQGSFVKISRFADVPSTFHALASFTIGRFGTYLSIEKFQNSIEQTSFCRLLLGHLYKERINQIGRKRFQKSLLSRARTHRQEGSLVRSFVWIDLKTDKPIWS